MKNPPKIDFSQRQMFNQNPLQCSVVKVQNRFNFFLRDKGIIFSKPSDFIDMLYQTTSTRPWRVFEGVAAAGEAPRPVLDTPEANRILTISCLNPCGYFPVRSALHLEKMNHVSDLQGHLRTLTAEMAI
jgi:hypothetical protein